MISRQTIDFIRSLAHKKEREIAGCFVAEGEKLVFDLLKTALVLEELYVTDEGMAALEGSSVEKMAVRLSGKEMERISSFKNPSTVLALFCIPAVAKITSKTFRGVNLVLDGVQDPGNLGTIVRTADWFGISGVFCSIACADLYNPKCVQATMGALARVKVHYVDLVHFLGEAAENKIPVYGTFMEGENLFKTDLAQDALVVMGSEGKGISSELIPFLTKKISIPSYPEGNRELESLNVGISSALVCAEFRRRAKP